MAETVGGHLPLETCGFTGCDPAPETSTLNPPVSSVATGRGPYRVPKASAGKALDGSQEGRRKALFGPVGATLLLDRLTGTRPGKKCADGLRPPHDLWVSRLPSSTTDRKPRTQGSWVPLQYLRCTPVGRGSPTEADVKTLGPKEVAGVRSTGVHRGGGVESKVQVGLGHDWTNHLNLF